MDPSTSHPSPARASRPVVLLHGVGIGARSMAPLVTSIERTGRRAVALDRPGYGVMPGPATVDEQAAWLVAACRSLDAGRVDLIGVSGGATVALAALCDAPDAFGRVVLHEPLVGPLAPALHAAIVESSAELARDPSTDALCAFIRRLVGADTMDRLDAGVVDSLVRAAATVRAEVPSFADFAPSPASLRRLCSNDVVTTLGGRREAPARSAAAEVLAELAGVAVVVLEGAGHLAQVDDPDALADVMVAGAFTGGCS
jgi:pimeloyl-ACP methyl ester carboxylesterase